MEPAVVALPWWLIVLAAPFVTTFREMLEMRYLWRIRLRMDNAHLEAVIGAEPHPRLDEAVETTLVGLGCLDGRSPGCRSIALCGDRVFRSKTARARRSAEQTGFAMHCDRN